MKIILSLLLCAPVMAKQAPAVQAESITYAEYQAQLLLNPEWLSFSDYEIQRLRNEGPKEELLENFKSAKRSDLVGDESSALIYYLKVAALKLSADWDLPERNALIFSFRRIADLTKEQNTKMKWQQTYLTWKNLESPSTDFFKKVALPNHWSNYRYALINGALIKINSDYIWLPNSQFRITFVSDKYISKSFLMTIEQAMNLRFVNEPIMTARCVGQARAHMDLPIDTVMILKNCIKPLNESITAIPRIEPLTAENAPGIDQSFSHSIKSKPRVIESGWFWAGIGLLAGAIYLNNKSKESDAVQTTRREGF